jgi:subtilisin family serine protease
LRGRVTLLIVATAALVVATSAAAALEPIQRSFGLRSVPLVRNATLHVPPGHAAGRTRVIVTLGLPPLADVPFAARTTSGVGAYRRLDVHASSSRAYLARLDAAQQRAIVAIRRAIPSAQIQERFRIVLDGITVELPQARLPVLYRLGFVQHVYPSLRYTRDLNRSTSIIGAPQLMAATGASGEGIKVAVVDDGVDQMNPFLDPKGFSYPAGFPKGNPSFTTPKVIVAKDFPAPTSTIGGRLPLDRDQSFHGTFVAGVIAGDANTTAPASNNVDCKLGGGRCHPQITGLSGVAPRAWIGNYRVFNVPNPLGGCCQGNTPEIAAAFEAAVTDGMNVINFSGGGSESDPSTDALIQVVANVTKAGVPAIISAGNDRDLFGLGTVGSPSTAPDAISVAAVTNEHVFGRALTLDGSGLGPIEIVPAPGGIPDSWASGRPIVDTRSTLCTPLPPGALQGAVALVTRGGGCTWMSKGDRARDAGAVGIVVVNDRPGDADFIQVGLAIPTGMVADIDGARLRDALARTGGRGTIHVSPDTTEIVTNRGDIPTSFSSAGPTAFAHILKPDLSAPGAQIVSSTLIEYASSGFAVLDGTSFSAPHVAGAAALLLQLHPSWTPAQLKSALMSTAGPVYGDSARTTEASVLLEGAGLAQLPAANDPKIFSVPQSLSFQSLNVSGGAQSRALQVTLTDAGGGAGTWQIELHPQSATAGASVDVVSATSLAPGGAATFQVTANASAGATSGDNYGFVVLRRGNDTRRIPYYFSVDRPALAGAQVLPLKKVQTGTTASGENRAQFYRWPTTPFGPAALLGVDQPVPEDGAEKVYSVDLAKRAVNFGAVVVSPRPKLNASIQSLLFANAPIHPWLLGSLDENDVLGATGTPVNANTLLPDYLFADGAAGTTLAAPGRYYFVVDSSHDPFTGQSLAGPFVLKSWIDDVKPPRVQLLTSTVATGRPTIVARVTDNLSGVDPLSLLLATKTQQAGAAMYDPQTGLVVFAIPNNNFSPLLAGTQYLRIVAADYQEAKNAYVGGDNLLPNTTFKTVQLNVVKRPTATWIKPAAGACARGTTPLMVVASSSAQVSSVIFYDGARRIARVKKNTYGIYTASWRPRKGGAHRLTAVVADTAGRESQAARAVRVCR